MRQQLPEERTEPVLGPETGAKPAPVPKPAVPQKFRNGRSDSDAHAEQCRLRAESATLRIERAIAQMDAELEEVRQ